MPTGTTSDFDVSRDELVRGSLRLLGVTDPSNQEISDAVESLNVLVRHLDIRGDHLNAISNTESTLTLIAGQDAYETGVGASEISDNILKLEYCTVLVGTEREDLVIFDKPTSLRTPLKSETNSQPVAVYLEKHKLTSDNRMFFYPTPNSAYIIKYNFRRPLYDFDLLSDNPDFSSSFLKPLKYLLAYDLTPEYGTPMQERQQLLGDGERAWELALAGEADQPSYIPLKTEYY